MPKPLTYIIGAALDRSTAGPYFRLSASVKISPGVYVVHAAPGFAPPVYKCPGRPLAALLTVRVIRSGAAYWIDIGHIDEDRSYSGLCASGRKMMRRHYVEIVTGDEAVQQAAFDRR